MNFKRLNYIMTTRVGLTADKMSIVVGIC